MSDDLTPKKPEWFELAESEASTADEVSSSAKARRLPIIALLATGAILASGAVFANIREDQPAVAEDRGPQNFGNNPNFNGPLGDSITAPSGDGAIQAPPLNGPDQDGDHPFPPRDGRRHDRDHEDGDHENREHRFDDDSGAAGGIPSTGTDA